VLNMSCQIKSLVAALVIMLSACGGGSGSSNDGPAPPPPVDPAEAQASASRLASRATFGMSYNDIVALAETGEEAWLSQQFNLPVGLHDPIVSDLLQRQAAGEFEELEREFTNIEFAFRRMAWWQQAIFSQDVLRQRIAFALSEILVVSDKVDILAVFPYALSNYQDMLLTNAFGNFRDLLRAVTLHPSMGVYLSHINNARANPENNTFPDENYAREVMQLFSIGLFELNPDGSEKTDANGDRIPTYNNEDIREFAKIFTGLSFGGPNTMFGGRSPVFRQPMRMFESFHEPGPKVLLGGTIVADGQDGMADIDSAIDNLFMHPNVGPFIGKQLIQRLVTSNPSPDYINRVSEAFADNGSGVRGDMQAVIRAILFDPEAQAEPGSGENFGKLREPLLRFLTFLKTLGVSSPDGFYANTGYIIEAVLQQHPLSAFSVFNFFLPGHQPVGEIAEAGLVAPEFQLTNSNTVVAITNLADAVIFGDFVNDLARPPFQPATLDFSDYQALIDDPEELLERLDLVMTYNTLSDDTRQMILDTLIDIDDPDFRLATALYLLYVSPDYAVQL